MKNNFYLIIFVIFMLVGVKFIKAEVGYKLWLKYNLIFDGNLLKEYIELIRESIVEENSTVIHAVRNELQMGFDL